MHVMFPCFDRGYQIGRSFCFRRTRVRLPSLCTLGKIFHNISDSVKLCRQHCFHSCFTTVIPKQEKSKQINKKNYLDGESKVKKKTAYKQIEKDELKVDLSG